MKKIRQLKRTGMWTKKGKQDKMKNTGLFWPGMVFGFPPGWNHHATSGGLCENDAQPVLKQDQLGATKRYSDTVILDESRMHKMDGRREAQ